MLQLCTKNGPGKERFNVTTFSQECHFQKVKVDLVNLLNQLLSYDVTLFKKCPGPFLEQSCTITQMLIQKIY